MEDTVVTYRDGKPRSAAQMLREIDQFQAGGEHRGVLFHQSVELADDEWAWFRAQLEMRGVVTLEADRQVRVTFWFWRGSGV